MKKVLNFFMILILACFTVVKAEALTFEEAFSRVDSKPMVVLVYAQWADNYQSVLQNFRLVKNQLSESYNFVELDIASNDAKSFNSRYEIYRNLPYVLMFRNGGKVSRYVSRDCASSTSCMSSKLKSFIQ